MTTMAWPRALWTRRTRRTSDPTHPRRLTSPALLPRELLEEGVEPVGLEGLCTARAAGRLPQLLGPGLDRWATRAQCTSSQKNSPRTPPESTWWARRWRWAWTRPAQVLALTAPGRRLGAGGGVGELLVRRPLSDQL